MSILAEMIAKRRQILLGTDICLCHVRKPYTKYIPIGGVHGVCRLTEIWCRGCDGIISYAKGYEV